MAEVTIYVPSEHEVRITDPVTGGQKGSKIQRFSLIPREFLWALAEHYGVGAKKYADRNWERGYKWSLSLDASERHLNQFILGETYDEETGTHHLIAAIWHLIALYIFDRRGLGTDDITRKPEQHPGPPGLSIGSYCTPGAANSVHRETHHDRQPAD